MSVYEYSFFMNKVFGAGVPAVPAQLKYFRCHDMTKSKKIFNTLSKAEPRMQPEKLVKNKLLKEHFKQSKL